MSFAEMQDACDRIRRLQDEAERLLTSQRRAAGDDTHYYRASLQHYTDWLVVNGFCSAEPDAVCAYLDAMNSRGVLRVSMRKARKVLDIVRKTFP